MRCAAVVLSAMIAFPASATPESSDESRYFVDVVMPVCKSREDSQTVYKAVVEYGVPFAMYIVFQQLIMAGKCMRFTGIVSLEQEKRCEEVVLGCGAVPTVSPDGYFYGVIPPKDKRQ